MHGVNVAASIPKCGAWALIQNWALGRDSMVLGEKSQQRVIVHVLDIMHALQGYDSRHLCLHLAPPEEINRSTLNFNSRQKSRQILMLQLQR